MSTIITKDGKVINLNGTLSMTNGEWYLNGNKVNIDELASNHTEDEKTINITINLSEGSTIDRLEVDHCKTITINGNCKRVTTHMGDITVTGDVDGDVHTNMGSIECGNVGGDAHTNMGSVRFRR